MVPHGPVHVQERPQYKGSRVHLKQGTLFILQQYPLFAWHRQKPVLEANNNEDFLAVRKAFAKSFSGTFLCRDKLAKKFVKRSVAEANVLIVAKENDGGDQDGFEKPGCH